MPDSEAPVKVECMLGFFLDERRFGAGRADMLPSTTHVKRKAAKNEGIPTSA